MIKKEYKKNGLDVGENFYNSGKLSSRQYKLKGIDHREDGPNYESFYENGNLWYRTYCINGKYHRVDGPAWTNYNNDGTVNSKEYWIDDKEYTEEQFRHFTRLAKLKHED